MEKIILSKNILKKGLTNSAFIYLTKGSNRYSDENKLIKKFGFKEVMKSLFNEDIESNTLAESALYQFYSEILNKDKEKDKCYKENDKFIELYKIDERFALKLDFNIYLYHLVPKDEFYTKMVPWYYADSEKYLGDTWGEQDDEVIESIQNLSVIDFLKRYKGY